MKVAIAGKGGSGKTTIAGTLARVMADRGQRVVAIDDDSNPNLRLDRRRRLRGVGRAGHPPRSARRAERRRRQQAPRAEHVGRGLHRPVRRARQGQPHAPHHGPAESRRLRLTLPRACHRAWRAERPRRRDIPDDRGGSRGRPRAPQPGHGTSRRHAAHRRRAVLQVARRRPVDRSRSQRTSGSAGSRWSPTRSARRATRTPSVSSRDGTAVIEWRGAIPYDPAVVEADERGTARDGPSAGRAAAWPPSAGSPTSF